MTNVLRPFLDRWRLCALLASAGMLATAKSGDKFAVYQTRIALSDSGKRAANAPRQTLATAASSSSSVVRSAQTVSCGKNNPGVNEPQS